MKEFKLISMTTFVLAQNYTTTLDMSQIDFYDRELSILSKIRNYAQFLKQPLKLEMFVPCVEGEPIEYFELKKTGGKFCQVGSEIEKESREKVLFKGFTAKEMDGKFWYVYDNNGEFFYSFPLINSDLYRKVEDLIQLDLELTESAINQLGL